jgi:trehalose 6-phosphate phosphatase
MMIERPVRASVSAGPPRPEIPGPPWCLFLDVDGTLLEIAPTPDSVRVDPALIDLLRRLERACGGAMALITGRPIAEVDALFAPLQLPVAGVHGFERRNAQGCYFRPTYVGSRLNSLLKSEVTALAHSLHGLLVEDKGCAFALHYRQVPHLEETVRLRMARLVSATLPAFELLQGDFVVEVKPVEFNKATAIEAFMREAPFSGRTPVFIGDDTTDLDGFAAIERLDGLAIAVGPRIPGRLRLSDPRDVRAWLAALLGQREV